MSHQMKSEHPERRVLGAFLMIVAMTLITLGDGIGKSLTEALPPLEVMLGRFCAHFLWIAPFVIFRHRKKLVYQFHLRAQIIRATFLVAALLFFYLSIVAIPLARAISLLSIAPFIVAALSFAVLGERVRITHLIYIAGGFGGVLLIARPDIGLELHNLLAVMAGIFYAFFLLASGKFPSTPPEVGSFYVAVVGVVVLLPLMFFIDIKPLNFEQIGIFIFIGGLIATAHYCIVVAYKYAQAAFLSLFVYWEIVAAIIIGLILHDDIPSIHEWIGITVIIFCGMMILLHGEKQKI